jgi:hypothetical protein
MTPFVVAIAAVTSATISGGALGAVPIAAAGADLPIAQPAQPKPPSPSSISSDVIVLHGTNDSSGIDPKIGKIPALAKPPFSAYNSYKLLDRTKLGLAKGKASAFKLPTGRELSVMYKDVVAQKNDGDKPRFVITTSIQKPGGNSFLPLLEVNAKAGEYFFVAGQQYKGGMLVIGIKVNP